MRISHEIEITPESVLLDGRSLALEGTGECLLTELYRRYVGDYPKFYKMDTLSRLGFVASELLLQREMEDEGCVRFAPRADRAVIMANRSASIKNDRDYEATISGDTYYPSPALFVYTLPNIVTGEIAIRNHYMAETAFYILETPARLEPIVASTFAANPALQSAIAGWCECSEANRYYAKIQIIWKN